jgi:putative redox protein
MVEELEVSAELINQKVQFKGISKSNPDRPVQFDYKPPVGDGQGFAGLELLLLSLAGCSGTAVVFLLRKMGRTISGLKVNARGIKREVHPMSFEKIFLEFVIDSEDTTEQNILRAIQLSEESICPVWAMIKNNVEVITGYKIEKSKTA